MRAWCAGLCAALGVFFLAGPGLALLTFAVVLYLTPMPTAIRTLARSARDGTTRVARRCWSWLRSGRHEVAIALALAAAVLAPVGAFLAFGIGAALLVAATLAAIGSLLLGWDARPAP